MSRYSHLAVVAILFALAACGTTATTGAPSANSTGSQGAGAITAPSPQPVKSQFLTGNAAPSLPAGAAGKMAVVAQSPLVLPVPSGGETVPIAVRNNTAQTVNITAQGAVKDSNGNPVASGSDQGFHPATLAPGQVGLGFIYLQIGSNVPAGSTMTVQASGKPVSPPDTYFADLAITAVNNTGSKIVGTASNPRSYALQQPFSADVFCFDGSGALTAEIGTFSDANSDIPSGGTTSFTIPLAGTACDHYLAGVSGFDDKAAGN